MTSFRLIAAVSALAAMLGTGCATAKASSPSPLPTLAPSDVPARVIAEYQPDPPLPAEPVSTEAVTPPPQPSRPARRDVARADGPLDEPLGPSVVVPTPAAVPPSLALQGVGTGPQADQSVRTLLAQAARDLGRVDYQALDTDGRAQYDTARRFMQQADEALKGRNAVFAGKLADKAATMAAVLVR